MLGEYCYEKDTWFVEHTICIGEMLNISLMFICIIRNRKLSYINNKSIIRKTVKIKKNIDYLLVNITLTLNYHKKNFYLLVIYNCDGKSIIFILKIRASAILQSVYMGKHIVKVKVAVK